MEGHSGNKFFENGSGENTDAQPTQKPQSQDSTYNPDNDTRSSGDYGWPTPD